MPAHLRPMTVRIPASWAPEQALAVLDLLDDLRQAIRTRYGSEMQPLLQHVQDYPAGHGGDDSHRDALF
jgi:hypothetical protein